MNFLNSKNISYCRETLHFNLLSLYLIFILYIYLIVEKLDKNIQFSAKS